MKEFVYCFEITVTQKDYTQSISDEVLTEALLAMIEICEDKGLVASGGVHDYFWLDDILYWITKILMTGYWRLQHVKAWFR